MAFLGIGEVITHQIAAFRVTVLLLALAAFPVKSEQAAAPDFAEAKAGSTGSPEGKAHAPTPSLAEIIVGLQAIDASDREIHKRLSDTARRDSLVSEIDEEERELSRAGAIRRDVPADLTQYFDLTDLTVSIRGIENRLAAASDTVAARAKALDVDLDRIAADNDKASVWLQTAMARSAPEALLERLRALPKDHSELAQQLRNSRDRALALLDRTTRLRDAARLLHSDVSDRRVQLEAQLRTAHATPIWRFQPQGEELSRSAQFVRSHGASVVDHVRNHAARLLLIAIVAFGLSYALIIAMRKPLALEERDHPYIRETEALFNAPITAAVLVALLAVVRYGPSGPVAYYGLFLSLLPVPAAILAAAILGRRITLSLYTLAAALFAMALIGPIVDPLPLTSRLLLIAQCVAVAAAVAVDLRRGRLEETFTRPPRMLVRSIARGIILVLVVAVVASVIGYLGAARILRNGVLGALGAALILSVAMHLLYGLFIVLLQTRAARTLRIARLHTSSVQRAVRAGLMIVGWLIWIIAMLQILGLLDNVLLLGQQLIGAEIDVGAARVPLAGIFAGIAVVVATYVVVKIVRLLLDVELLPRMRLKHGISFAISAAVRYVIITAGVLLAMAAMGIDLTKVTLLAGALGVGIGLGLQGVVNNFVSGLILLAERPISAGDSIQVGDLQGTVQSIGVRSTTIRTGQGAEVIVPNADLISKGVTNWTLSDRRRKVEIEVGVDRDTDPQTVIRQLEQAAASVERIAKTPAPQVLFTGFRDNSCDYRVLVWVDDVDDAATVQSKLRTIMAQRFKEAAIVRPKT